MKAKGTVVLGVDPLIIHDDYHIEYHHSYAQDSPFFVGLSQGKLRGSRCSACGYTFATPRAHCMECGAPTEWIDLPLTGRIHTFTTCYYGGELFLEETPFTLILVEFEGINTLFLSRLKGCDPSTVRIGQPVVARFAKTPSFKVTDVWFEPTGP
ncbi:MAG: Zn-ribbon domain-containing OB-fold protein [Nitrospirae bacterium]|nr:MAG: Zn-ribbon domain-containing OB-fold protein [Nitrospirota bacterium]